MRLVRESAYNFHKTGDIRSSLSIGGRSLIKEWLDKMGVRNYIINSDLSINVNGDVILFSMELEEFPDFIQFNEVSGGFSCGGNKLESLRGSPFLVGANFLCQDNLLESLEFSPKIIFGDFNCSRNKLVSLEGSPEYVGGNFFCFDYFRKFSRKDVLSVCEISPERIFL